MPSKTDEWVVAGLTADWATWLDGTFIPGQIRPDENWNGFACPRFARDVAEYLVTKLNVCHVEDPEGYERLEWQGDAVVGYDGDEITERWEPDADGFYHLGSHRWVWNVGLLP